MCGDYRPVVGPCARRQMWDMSGSSAGLCPVCFQGELGAEPGCEAVWEEVYVRQQRGDVLELGPGKQGS